MSLASAPQDAWARFDKDAQLPNVPPKKSVRIQEGEQAPQEDEAPAMEERTPSPTPQTPVVRITEPESPELGPVELSTVNDREFGEDEDDDMEMATPLKKTERWRENVEDGMYDEEEEELVSTLLPHTSRELIHIYSFQPVISIAQFFQMTGIRFMDELTAPRRSIHPSQNPTRQPREPQDIPVSEYVVAMAIDIPQLELYTRVSRDLEAWMEKSKSVFADAEEEAAKVTPELFVEYSRADEEGQADFLVSSLALNPC
jgi:kinetochore protein Spc7/SPC105